MDDNGSNVSQLTTYTGTDVAPSLSRDRTHLVYESFRFSSFDLFLIKADGTGEIRLTHTSDADETNPDISPDGRTIVFTRAGSLYAINSDGSGERRLTHSPGNSEHASFTARGDKLVFESDRGGNRFQIYVMNADGSGQQAITNDAGINASACFSPDGTQIVYASTRQADPSHSGIYLMHADGSKARPLVTSASSVNLEPVFSPDGQKVVFASNRANGNYDLYTIRIDGTGLTRLTDDPAMDAFPSWR